MRYFHSSFLHEFPDGKKVDVLYTVAERDLYATLEHPEELAIPEISDVYYAYTLEEADISDEEWMELNQAARYWSSVYKQERKLILEE